SSPTTARSLPDATPNRRWRPYHDFGHHWRLAAGALRRARTRSTTNPSTQLIVARPYMDRLTRSWIVPGPPGDPGSQTAMNDIQIAVAISDGAALRLDGPACSATARRLLIATNRTVASTRAAC